MSQTQHRVIKHIERNGYIGSEPARNDVFPTHKAATQLARLLTSRLSDLEKETISYSVESS